MFVYFFLPYMVNKEYIILTSVSVCLSVSVSVQEHTSIKNHTSNFTKFSMLPMAVARSSISGRSAMISLFLELVHAVLFSYSGPYGVARSV